MTSIAIIQGHPDASGTHLCHALADAYARGAGEAGHRVARIDIATLDFPLLRSQADFMDASHRPASLDPAADAIASANHVVIVFPLWLGTMPALLKAFLEQIMRPGTAFAYQDKGFPKKLLAGRSARIVVTMGMPAMFYRWFYGAHGVRVLERNILNFVGIKPVRTTLLGNAEGAGDAGRKRWIEAMEQLGRQAA